MNGLTIRDLGASYGRRRVLTAVDLNLAAGEMLAVLGPSGCGKTTLLRSIAGLHPIDHGRIELDGRELARPPAVHVAPEHRHIGLMPQEGGLFPHLSVGDNVGFGLVKALHHRRIGDRAARLRRVHEMLDLVGLADAVNARPNELSGGQQQRIALARALAPAPSVVLMDEPFASLDAGLRAGIRQEVRELLAHTGTPALLVTHDRAEAMTTADRVMVLLGGRDAQTGTPEDLYRRPVSAELGSFVGEAHVVDAVRNGGRAETVLGSVDVAEGSSGRGSVLVRPEQLQPVADPEGRFRVLATYFAGPHIQVAVQHIDTGMSMTAWVRELDSLGAGSTVRLHVRGRVPFFATDSVNGHAVRRCASAATAAS